MTLAFILGIVCGILISILNVVIVKRDVQKAILSKLRSAKATIVDMEDPLDKLEL